MKANLTLNLYLSILFSFFFFTVNAQVYEYTSENLPANGAMGQSMDVQVADIDGDGDLDIVLANEFQANTILLNDGNAVFENGSLGNLPAAVHDSEDVAIADYDQDGDLDLIFCSEDDFVHEYYLNNGTGSFTAHPTFQFANSKANAVITADINGDTYPDVFFGNDGQNSLYLNIGDGTFSNVSNNQLPSLNDTTQDLNLEDVDKDGDLDLFVGNENGNKLLINIGNGFFEDETVDRLPTISNVETRKVTFGDVNGDDAPDIFLSNVQFIPGMNRQNRLFLNDGNGNFSDATSTNLPFDNDDTLDAIFEDVDDDDDLDIVIANVNLQTQASQKVYINDGTGQFSNNSISILGGFFFGDALGVTCGDFNNNGLTDLYFCDRNIGNNNKDLLFLKKMSTPVELLESAVPLDVRIYPNPVAYQFNIEFNTPVYGILNVTLSDASGKVVYKLEPIRQNDKEYLIFLPNEKLETGIYYIRIETNERQIIQKMMIEN